MIQQLVFQIVLVTGLSTAALWYINDFFKVKHNSPQWSFLVVVVTSLVSGIFFSLVHVVAPSLVVSIVKMNVVGGVVAYFLYKQRAPISWKNFINIWIVFTIADLLIAVLMYQLFGAALL